MKMESLQQRREELERKEFQLKESLLRFDKFLKVNFNKMYSCFYKGFVGQCRLTFLFSYLYIFFIALLIFMKL